MHVWRPPWSSAVVVVPTSLEYVSERRPLSNAGTSVSRVVYTCIGCQFPVQGFSMPPGSKLVQKGKGVGKAYTIRAGEGAPVGVQVSRLADGDGSGIAFAVEVAAAPVPDRRYAADVAGAIVSEKLTRLFFGQTKLVGSELRSLLVVHMGLSATARFLENSEGLIASIREYCERAKVALEPQQVLEAEPNQVVAVEANILGVTFAASEATIDCYHLAPDSIHRLKVAGTASEIGLDPVVRIMLPVQALLTLYDSLESQKDVFMSFLEGPRL